MNRGAHPTTANYIICVDCQTSIPSYGGRKRCPVCQERNYRERHKVTKKKQRDKAKLKE